MSAAPRRECPHGEDCGCVILTRHEWYAAYCDSAAVCEKLRAELRALRRPPPSPATIARLVKRRRNGIDDPDPAA